MTHKTKFHKICFPQLLGTKPDADHKFQQLLCTKADADHKFPQSLHTKADAKKFHNHKQITCGDNKFPQLLRREGRGRDRDGDREMESIT
jgi:hypothetical protein